MKYLKSNLFLTFTIFLLACSSLHCQDLQSIPSPSNDQKKKKSRLTREFARVSTGNTFSTIGNFASISSKTETLSASLFFLTKSDNVINISVSGGATQGVATIFDEGDLNTNASIGVTYNLMLRKANNAIAINSTAEDVIRLEIENANRKYQKKVLALLKDDYITDLDKDIITAQQTKALLQAKSQQEDANIKAFKKNLADAKVIQEAVNQKNAFDSQILDIDALITDMNGRKNAVDRKKYYELINAYTVENESKVATLSNKIRDLKPDAVSFSWVSFGYTAKNNSFKLFDSSLDLEKQVFGEEYATQSLSLSYNHISNARAVVRSGGEITSFQDKKREYLSVGAKFDYTNNLSSLKQVEIRDTEIIDQESGRTKIKKQNAFSGEYEEDLNNLTAFIDYYNFIASNDIVAIHLNPIMLFRENFKPVASFQFGVLLPFKDKAKQSTKVNLEVFYKVKDVFNTTNNDNALLNRNTIGIQASFPFNF